MKSSKVKLSLFKKISLVIILGFSFFTLADRYSHVEIFAQALTTIKVNYFKNIEFKNLISGAIKGMLNTLDPHSQFLLPEDLQNLKEEATGQFYGLGIEVEKKDHFLIVLSVLNNSPAKKAGFKTGDKILKIDNELTKNISLNKFRKIFKKNRIYNIQILRSEENKIFNLKIRPESLKIKSVKFQEIKNGFFYLRVYYFSSKTLFEINKSIKNKKIKALLLDLRENPGGIFDQAVKVADLFLDEGIIASYKIKTENKVKEFKAHYSDTLETFPIVVLIDEFSASSSEILAGALKDHKRATLIGRKTFGKGSIQNIFPLKNNHALKLTVGEYKTPSGELIHNKGITPDIIIKKEKKELSKNSKLLEDREIVKAFEILKGLIPL
ncbi:MAG: S41 family peptidase [Bdellovibrionaceae bacterium]|nr:S41 family peptidase [Pseudobdellovibrionaceae bacterium]